jgi:hypothetical protein
MSDILVNPPPPPCYPVITLFYEPGIAEFQWLAPDLFFASRAWQ